MMRRLVLALCLLIVIAVTVPACTGQHDLVILAGKLIDGTGSPAQHNVAITVRDGRITSITPLWGGVPRARRVIDARDVTVLPGLINACTRVDFWSEDGGHAWSHYGVTTVVDVGSSTEEIARHRHAFSGDDSPRLVVTGPAVIAPGHQFAHLTDPPDRVCVVIDPSEATRRIEQLMAQPAPDIVLAGRPWRELPSEPVMAAVIEQAHTGNRTVMVWADEPDDFRLAVEAGADTVLFVPGAIDEDLLERAVEQGLVLVPVLSTVCEMYPERRADIVAAVRSFTNWADSSRLGMMPDGGSCRLVCRWENWNCFAVRWG